MKKKIILISCFFLMMGCSSYIPETEISDMNAIDNIGNESTKVKDDKNMVFSTEKWWLIYNDPILNELMELTLEANSDLKIAMLNIEKAKITVEGAENSAFKAGLYASGNYYGTSQSYTKSKAIGPAPIGVPEDAFAGETMYGAGAGLKMSYNFNFYDKYGNLAKSQSFLAESAIFKTKSVELSITTNLAKLYGYYIYLSKESANLNERLETLTALEEKVEKIIEFGNGTPEDLLPIQNKILALKQFINLNEFNRKATIETINSLSSYKYKEDIDRILNASTSKKLLDQDFLIPSKVSSDVIVNRPDVQYYLMLIESEKAKLIAAKSDFYPQISIGGDIGYRGLGFDNSFQDFSSLMWSFGPKVYLPIFNLSGVKTQYKVAGVQINIFVENYNKTINGAIKEINDNLTSVQMAKRNYENSEKNYENNKIIYDNSNLKLEIGSISEYKNLNDKYVYLGAAIRKEQQNYKVYSEQIDLINSLGGVYKTKAEIEKELANQNK